MQGSISLSTKHAKPSRTQSSLQAVGVRRGGQMNKTMEHSFLLGLWLVREALMLI